VKIKQKTGFSNNMMKAFKVGIFSAILLLSLSACLLFQADRSKPTIVVVKEEMSLEEAMTLVAEATAEGIGSLKSEGEAAASATPYVNSMEQGESLPHSAKLQRQSAGCSGNSSSVQAATEINFLQSQGVLCTQTQVIRQRTLAAQ
jgi:hypothetical protein